MNPQRNVRRVGARPTYVRRTARPPQRPRIQPPVVQTAWLKAAAITTGILIVLVLVARLTTLTHVTIKGNKALAAADVQQMATQGAHKQWFGHNTILINTSALSDYLQQTEPAIKQASVHRSLPHGLTVTLTERQPSLNWQSGGAVYLLDGDGTAIGPTTAAYAKLPTVIDSSNVPVKQGSRVAPATFVSFSVRLASLLPAAGYPITSLTVPASTSEVYAKTTKNLTIKFDTTRPAGEEIADLTKVQAELTKAKKTPSEYIDVRIPNKAYYR